MTMTTSNTTSSHSTTISAQAFAFKIKRELNFATTTLTDHQLYRLGDIRRLALQRHKAPQTRFVMRLLGTNGAAQSDSNQDDSTYWLKLFTSIVPIALIIFALFFATEWQTIDRVDELSDVDTLLLTDELPLEAYLDHGFKAFLQHGEDSTNDTPIRDAQQ
jgi:hypothetical protein